MLEQLENVKWEKISIKKLHEYCAAVSKLRENVIDQLITLRQLEQTIEKRQKYLNQTEHGYMENPIERKKSQKN